MVSPKAVLLGRPDEKGGNTMSLYLRLEKLMQLPDVFKQIRKPHKSTAGIMYDWCNGELFQQHEIFRQHITALQIILHANDVEFVNSLGMNTRKHKMTICSFEIKKHSS